MPLVHYLGQENRLRTRQRLRRHARAAEEVDVVAVDLVFGAEIAQRADHAIDQPEPSPAAFDRITDQPGAVILAEQSFQLLVLWQPRECGRSAPRQCRRLVGIQQCLDQFGDLLRGFRAPAARRPKVQLRGCLSAFSSTRSSSWRRCGQSDPQFPLLRRKEPEPDRSSAPVSAPHH